MPDNLLIRSVNHTQISIQIYGVEKNAQKGESVIVSAITVV